MQATLSEQEVVRREKLRELEALGIDPYPAPLFEITHTAVEIKEKGFVLIKLILLGFSRSMIQPGHTRSDQERYYYFFARITGNFD